MKAVSLTTTFRSPASTTPRPPRPLPVVLCGDPRAAAPGPFVHAKALQDGTRDGSTPLAGTTAVNIGEKRLRGAAGGHRSLRYDEGTGEGFAATTYVRDGA